MPTTTRLPTTTPTTEPVSLSLADVHMAADLNLNDARTAANPAGTAREQAQVEYMVHLLKAAREKAENYTGRFFVGGQRLALTFTLDEAYALPFGATVEGVTGFFDSPAALEAWHWAEYVKGSSVSRELPLCVAAQQTYTVTVQLPEAVDVPEVAKSAILELAAEWYKNREASVNGTISVETQVNWQRKLAELRLNPLG